jgi:hypothetical protein
MIAFLFELLFLMPSVMAVLINYFIFLRVLGDKVAEVPLVGTRFQYRRHGMCRILMDELEKVNKRGTHFPFLS